MNQPPESSNWRARTHEVIFGADTPAGKLFDVILLWCIVLSVVAVMLESVEAIQAKYGTALVIAEWTFTLLFTIEYFVRIACVGSPRRYIFSFFGIIDLLSILPTYLSLFFAGTQSLMVIRAVRLLRVFRVLKLAQFLGEAEVLLSALRASRRKITVFVGGVFTMVMIFGAMMFLIEGPEHGFTSLPKSMYWAIVTLTTVGYGDITPQTTLGQFVSAIVMVMGYGVIAVPTGIVSVEISRATDKVGNQGCPKCGCSDHRFRAVYCHQCAAEL